MKHILATPRAGFAAVLAVLASCSSTPPPRPLPLHAAFLPIVVKEKRSDVEPDEAPTVELNLEAEAIATRLADGLQGRGFTLVTNLAAHSDESAQSTDAAHDQAWQQQAAALGADVLIRVEVSYEPEIESAINEKFWLNLPLFLLGGPFCYFIDDRSYEGRATLQAEFFDLTDIHAKLDDARLLDFPILGEFSNADFDFVDRAGTSVGSYALSLLIPAGLLASGTESVDAELESEVVRRIVDGLLNKIGQLRVEFLNNDLATFHIIESQTIVQRAADGTVQVAFPVKLNDETSGLRDFVLKANDTELLSGALDRVPDSGGRIWIRGEGLVVDDGVQHLRLRVVDSVGGRRSYTFQIQDFAGRQ